MAVIEYIECRGAVVAPTMLRTAIYGIYGNVAGAMTAPLPTTTTWMTMAPSSDISMVHCQLMPTSCNAECAMIEALSFRST